VNKTSQMVKDTSYN